MKKAAENEADSIWDLLSKMFSGVSRFFPFSGMFFGTGVPGSSARRMDLWGNRRNVGYRGKKVIAFVEEINLPIVFAFTDGEEDAGVVAGAECNIGAESCAAAGFLDDGRWGGWVADLDPCQADTGWVAGVAQALDGFELLRSKGNAERRGRLRGRAWNLQQVLKEFDHVGGC